MTTTNAALISEHHQFYHMSQPQPQQQQQKQHEHRPRAARLTKQAPVQLNVTPPPPDRERELSLKAVLHRVTDRRSMYAKSKLSFKRLLTHRVSQGDVALNTPSIALESLDIGGGGELLSSFFLSLIGLFFIIHRCQKRVKLSLKETNFRSIKFGFSLRFQD